MAYDHITDVNGITWTVITTPDGYTMIASVLDAADPKYDPPAEDQIAKMPLNPGALELNNRQVIGADPPTGEQTRMLYLDLVKKVQDWAQAHKGMAMLKVTEKPPWGWIALGVIAILALGDGGKRRRRRRR